MYATTRREFLVQTSAAAAVVAAHPWSRLAASQLPAAPATRREANLAFGLVTYLWGADWDLPTLLSNCAQAGMLGVELRTTHAHGVEPTLNDAQRAEVRKRFADSGVTNVGIGSNERFDSPDPEMLKKAIAATKDFIRLSHDVGGSGVKVKPDRFHESVPREKTIEQIGRALNDVADYGAGFGQQIRLEVHGQCSELPTIKAILDVASNPNVAICWNSNAEDLKGQGLEYNYKLVYNRFGDTCHVHELNDPKYPYAQLFQLLVQSGYNGWLLLEAGGQPENRPAAFAQQVKLFHELVARAKS
jgi:sugar phosphate isomerase/epimerase